jgi:hypothetical protein
MVALILGIIFFLLNLVFGYFVVRLFKVFRSLEEQFFASIVVGIAFSSWFVYLGFFVFGDSAVLAAAFVEVELILVFFLFKRFPRIAVERSKGFWVRFLPILLVLTALFVQGALHLDSNGDYVVSKPFFWDLPDHLSIVTNFAYRVNAPAENPYFAGVPFYYPFLTDVYSASLLRAGMPLEIAYNLPAYALILSFFALCYFLFLRLHSDKNIAFAAILILFFASSFRVPDFALDFVQNPASTLFHSSDYLILNADFAWGSQLITLRMLPHRASDLGYPLAVIIFVLLLEGIDLLKSKQAKARLECRNLFLFAGVLAGLLPTIREFAFLAVCVVAVGLALFYRGRRWLWFFVPLLLLALPQVFSSALYVAEGGGTMLAWEPGCLGQAACDYQMNVFETVSFWFFTLGLPLLLAVVGFLLVSRKAQRFTVLLFVVFVLAVLFRFTPDRSNNFKLIDLWLVGMSFLAAVVIVGAWKKRGCWKALAVVALAASLLPGMLFMQRDASKTFVAYSKEDIRFAEWINANTSRDAVFMSYSAYNAPNSLDLAGRQKVMGRYLTVRWLGEAGWAERLEDQKDFYSGKRTQEILAKYNVSFVAFTHTEYYSDIFYSFNYSAIKSAPFLRLVYLQEAPDANPNPRHYWMGRWALYEVVCAG